jgi:hypothetical protein
MYNWRLAVYAPVAKELYDRYLTMCRGTILQPNSYDISVDDNTQEYIKNGYVYDTLYKAIPFVLENPYAYMAVIEGEAQEKDNTEDLKPCIEFIPVEKLIMLDHESCAFKLENGNVVFLDQTTQVIVKGKETFQSTHNFNKLPFWEINNNFMQPFESWADLLVRNMNDDEQMTKQYSYPTRQAVRPSCNYPGTPDGKYSACISGNITDMSDPMNPTKLTCGVCGGSGVKSINPGDDYTLSEESIIKNGGNMIEMIKYITPDVGIPEYHLSRWQVFYDRTEKSLCLNKKINATESGEAKREDRKDQYFYLMTISNFVFENFKHAIEYISAYLNYNQASGTFKSQEVIVTPPKQFDLMTDSDLVVEFAELQNKTDDSQLLAELQYQVNRRLYRTDKVQLTINEILYYKDPLYGVSGNALKSKLLSGVYSTPMKILHEMGYNILKDISREMTPRVFENTDTKTLIRKLELRIQELVPQDIYSESGQSGNTLKDSVGGLTGMIEIAKAVASGLYDLEAAIALVSDRFGLTEEEARKQLGTPQIQGAAAVEKVATLV